MRTVINLVLDHPNQILKFIVVAVVAMLLTYLVYWITNKNRVAKFIPGLVSLLAGFYNLQASLPLLNEPAGLKKLNGFGMFFVAGFVSICYSFILGIYSKRKRI